MAAKLQAEGTDQPRKSPTWRTRLPVYYGWVVLGSVFLFLTLSYGIHYSFSVFFVALIEDFGWDRASTAGIFSIYVLILSSSGAIAGTLVDRFGPSRVVPFGAVLTSIGLVATSRITELWQFYIFLGLGCGLGIALAGWVPCVALVSRWFDTKRGVAMGIATAGMSMGTVMMVPLSQYLISIVGWREAYQVLAVIAPVSPVAAADIFGGKNFGAIYGVMCTANGIGSAFGAWMAGYVFDVTGSYFVAFGMAIASSILAAVSLWFAAPRAVRRVVKTA